MNHSLVDRFRTLPEAKQVPEEVWTAQNLLDRLTDLDIEREKIMADLTEITPRMIDVLRENWTNDELREANLLAKTEGKEG